MQRSLVQYESPRIANPQAADHQRKKWLSECINDKEFSDDNDDDDEIISIISEAGM